MSVDFKPPNVKNGFESLPSRLRLGPSGYTHNTPVTTALYHHKASSNTKYRAEYPKKTFREEGPPPSANTLKETSGYSHSFNIEPVTYRPTECHSGEVPGEFTWRPTGKSLTKKDFMGWVPMSGHESLPVMTARANESNGYIKGNTHMAKAQPRDTRVCVFVNKEDTVGMTETRIDIMTITNKIGLSTKVIVIVIANLVSIIILSS